MVKKIGLAAAAGMLALLAGCGNLNSIYRSQPMNEPRSISVDAKQRMVLMGKRYDQIIACAEPSPDALSAYAAAVSASVSQAERQAIQAAFSGSETAAFVGLRTQTIQLLRDGMYRICEGYLSGALGSGNFGALQRRYQNLMMGLLAIEQLTGAVTPRPVVLSNAASAGTGSSTEKEEAALTKAQEHKAETDATLAAAQKTYEAKDAAQKTAQQSLTVLESKQKETPPGATDAEINAAKEALRTAQTELSAAEIELSKRKNLGAIADADVKLKQDNLRAAQLRVFAGTNGTGSDTSAVKLDATTSKTLADAITGIVREVIGDSFIQDACLDFLSGEGSGQQKAMTQALPGASEPSMTAEDDIRTVCAAYLRSRVADKVGVRPSDIK